MANVRYAKTNQPDCKAQRRARALDRFGVRTVMVGDADYSGWGSFGSRGSERRRGPGWTQAKVQRMARKKRNQQRHRKACRS
jgi:hypothetical protein